MNYGYNGSKLTKIKCRNCGIIKNTVSYIDIGNNDSPILEHWNKISKCCKEPDYEWKVISEFTDIVYSKIGSRLGCALVNGLPDIIQSLYNSIGKDKTNNLIEEYYADDKQKYLVQKERR